MRRGVIPSVASGSSLMLQNLKQLYGRRLSACDGQLGWLHDFYFDDVTWTIRYAVADTGGWLAGRQVIFPVGAFENFPIGRSRPDGGLLHLNTDRRRLAAGPRVRSGDRFSPQLEEEFVRCHQLPAYWAGDGPAEPLTASSSARLHRTRDVAGYRLHALEDLAGTVGGFMLKARSWEIGGIVIDTGAWFFGRRVSVLPAQIDRIDEGKRLLHAGVSAQALYEASRERQNRKADRAMGAVDADASFHSSVH